MKSKTCIRMCLYTGTIVSRVNASEFSEYSLAFTCAAVFFKLGLLLDYLTFTELKPLYRRTKVPHWSASVCVGRAANTYVYMLRVCKLFAPGDDLLVMFPPPRGDSYLCPFDLGGLGSRESVQTFTKSSKLSRLS